MKLFCAIALLLLFFASPFHSAARDIPPFVSTDWLEQNGNAPSLLIVDVRAGADYKKAHIPQSISSDANSWAVNKNGLLRELPTDHELVTLLGSLGIKEDSKVVVVGKGVTDFDRADAVRVAWTMVVSGVKNVSVLDGGFAKWLKDKKPTSSDPSLPTPGEYRGKVDAALAVSKKYVESRIGKSVLVDARVPEVYFGMETEPWALKPGHIESAVSLPAPWVFTKDGLVRGRSELEGAAAAAAGTDKAKEYIIYCGAGVYATVWSFVMTEWLGYKDVKVYDGSMQEWIMAPAGSITKYGWR